MQFKKPILFLSLICLVFLSPSAFALQWGDFTYTVSNGTVTITGYTGGSGVVVIPATIDGMPVVSIGDFAFAQCSGLNSVVIPDIVTSIGSNAFRWCSSLTSVTIGNGVTSIGNDAFALCSNLTNIVVDASNSVYSSQDGVLYDKAKIVLIRYPGGKSGGFTIPDSVMSIEKYTFAYCSSLTSVTIPDSVTSIGSSAFEGCISLTNVIIPNSITSIGNLTFALCSNLTRAYFLGNAPTMGSQVFVECSSIFTICYTAGSTGFTNPWYGYPAYPCGETTSSTTSVQKTTTTIVPEEDCSASVISTILPLNAGQLPHVRRIVITGKNSNWDSTTAVSIEDIPILIPLRVQPTMIIAFILIPSTLTGFMPGEKEVGVATGVNLCTGTVVIE